MGLISGSNRTAGRTPRGRSAFRPGSASRRVTRLIHPAWPGRGIGCRRIGDQARGPTGPDVLASQCVDAIMTECLVAAIARRPVLRLGHVVCGAVAFLEPPGPAVLRGHRLDAVGRAADEERQTARVGRAGLGWLAGGLA